MSPEIEEVLVRQLDEQLLQHREPADARVEDGDRTLVAARVAGDGHRRHDPRWSPAIVRAVRALVVSNMAASRESPGARHASCATRSRRCGASRDVEVELFEFAARGAAPTRSRRVALRRRFGGTRFDVVHAHFGLTRLAGARAARRRATRSRSTAPTCATRARGA